MSTAFERIRDSWVPVWLKGFERKARDYNTANGGWENHEVLGVKGQFADIWRKIGKLKKALWHDEKLEGEQPLEIIDDLISHLFLTRDLLLQQQKRLESTRLAVLTKTNLPPEDCPGGLCNGGGHAYVGSCLLRVIRKLDQRQVKP